MDDNIILVDENDVEIGTEEKLATHQKGLLHRAFSILIFDQEGNVLLQQRASDKYHSAGLWTNTCCSHPLPLEDIKESAYRRLEKEMGFQTEIRKAFTFIYKVSLENGIKEHEYDHVFTGVWNGTPQPDPEEVADWKWMNRKDLDKDIKLHPEHYTYWFKLIMERMGQE